MYDWETRILLEKQTAPKHYNVCDLQEIGCDNAIVNAHWQAWVNGHSGSFEQMLIHLAIDLATQNKQVAPGIVIRVLTKLQYDATEALKWAKHHDVALMLDRTLFEKIAKVTPPEFVEIVVEHQATIATDLEKALGTSNA